MPYRLSQIITKSGDAGTTSLGQGERLSKSAVRIQAIGSMDELNAFLGLARSYPMAEDSINQLIQIQRDLFEVGAELCLPSENRVQSEMTGRLEAWSESLNSTLPPLREFLIPGGDLTSAHLHVARAVCRRVERDLVELNEESALNPETLRYLNRLSDFLFILARVMQRQFQHQEPLWK